MYIVYGFFGNLYYVLRKYMREFWGFFQNREFIPTGRKREASRFGGNCEAGRIYSNEKAERSKQVGVEVLKTGRLLQVEGKGK